MRIPLGHVVRFMPKQPLDFIQVDPVLHEPRGERMAQVMEPKIWNTCSIASLTEFPTQEPHL
jgi:hypothetical protein